MIGSPLTSYPHTDERSNRCTHAMKSVIKSPTVAFLTPFLCLWLALILLSPIYKVTHGRKTPHLIRGIKGVYPEIILEK